MSLINPKKLHYTENHIYCKCPIIRGAIVITRSTGLCNVAELLGCDMAKECKHGTKKIDDRGE